MLFEVGETLDARTLTRNIPSSGIRSPSSMFSQLLRVPGRMASCTS